MTPRHAVVGALLVRLADRQLLLPASAVADVSSWPQPTRAAELPAWCLGLAHWREQCLPVVALDSLASAAALPALPPRLLVLRALGHAGHLGLRFFDTPRCLRLGADHKSADIPLGELERGALWLNGQPAIIADLPALERRLAALFPDWRPQR